MTTLAPSTGLASRTPCAQFSPHSAHFTFLGYSSSSAFTEALHRVGLFFATLADPANGLLNERDLNQRIDARLSSMVESFAEISRAFRARERERDLEIAFRNLPPVTAEDVKSAAESAADKIVAAIDNGTAKVARPCGNQGEKAAGRRLRSTCKKRYGTFTCAKRKMPKSRIWAAVAPFAKTNSITQKASLRHTASCLRKTTLIC